MEPEAAEGVIQATGCRHQQQAAAVQHFLFGWTSSIVHRPLSTNALTGILPICPASRTRLVTGAPSALKPRVLSMAAQVRSVHEFGIPVRRRSYPRALSSLSTKRTKRVCGGISCCIICTILPTNPSILIRELYQASGCRLRTGPVTGARGGFIPLINTGTYPHAFQ